MAAKTYPRFPLRVLRPRDQILGGTSDYYQIDEEASLIRDGFPLWDTGAGQLQAALAGNEITAFALQDPFDKNGAVLPSGSEIETFLAAAGRYQVSQLAISAEVSRWPGCSGSPRDNDPSTPFGRTRSP